MLSEPVLVARSTAASVTTTDAPRTIAAATDTPIKETRNRARRDLPGTPGLLPIPIHSREVTSDNADWPHSER